MIWLPGRDVMADESTSRMAGKPAEERAHLRYEGRLEASLVVDGGHWRCFIRDISLGGAGLEPEIPAALGRPVTLSCPFFSFEGDLEGRVVNVADDRTCLSFELDDDMAYHLAAFLAANS